MGTQNKLNRYSCRCRGFPSMAFYSSLDLALLLFQIYKSNRTEKIKILEIKYD